MSFLETFVQSPWASAIGWTLLHSLWQGPIVSVALLVVFLAARSPRVRYAAACLALLGMLAAFGLTLFELAPAGRHGTGPIKAPSFPAWTLPAVAGAAHTWDPSLAATAPWLAPVWMAGLFIFYIRYAVGFISLQRLRRRGVCSASDQWQRRLNSLCSQLRISRPVLLLESCLADAPMVMGHMRPLILVPIGLLTGLPCAQVEGILLHELAHIRRHDFLVNALQNLVDGLLFYHPAVWWISHVIRSEREKCCDDAVVEISGDAHEYASALAALEQNRWSAHEPAVAARGGSLMKRIHRLLYPSDQNGAWSLVLVTALLLTTAAITLSAWQTDPPRSQLLKSCPGANDAGTAVSHTVDYARWLNEDVAYIIEDAERAAFKSLTINDERDCFIAQFWLRRDPTPGTPENEFKNEHYRRIAYANKHFATASGSPGWQTDRGHIYILYGPPDEIDSHLKESRPYAVELWKYRYLEGIGTNSTITFVDKTGKGDYRAAPGTGTYTP
jgi:GWxTD domain-containing protein